MVPRRGQETLLWEVSVFVFSSPSSHSSRHTTPPELGKAVLALEDGHPLRQQETENPAE